VMREAALRDEDPFLKAKQLIARLFSSRPLTVGVERFYAVKENSTGSEQADSAESGPATDPPCGLPVDGERARLVRRHDREMLTPEGLWEAMPAAADASLGELLVRLPAGRWRSALTVAAIAQKHGFGALCKIRLAEPIQQALDGSVRPAQIQQPFEYGREIPLAAEKRGHWMPAKWLRKLLRERFPLLAAANGWKSDEFLKQVLPIVEAQMKGRLHEQCVRDGMIFGRFRFAGIPVTGYKDGRGRILENPETRRTYPAVCQPCARKADCEALELSVSPALAWRQLGLVDQKGIPTRRGVIFSFFNQGEGLAIAAALEERDYPIEDLVFDLANLRVGHRFSLDETYSHGRLGAVCQTVYQRGEYPGYLEMGLPIAYGPGGSEVVREVVAHQVPRHRLISESVRHGDIERALTEWRSLLRQITQAPVYDWDRWLQLREMASRYVHSTRSPARDPLPQLAPAQSQRYTGRFISRLARSA
jgi:hypothetical protein